MNKKPAQETFSVFEFFKKYPDEESARQYFQNILWGDNLECPHCNSKKVVVCKDHKPMPYHCASCRKYFSVRTNTVLAESRLPLQTWLLAIYILTSSSKGISSVKLAEYLGITQKSAWFLAHRIRETWLKKQSGDGDSDKLKGIVEVDETYIGGKEENKHSFKKLHQEHHKGKTVVMGMLERGGDVKAVVIANTESSTLCYNIRNHVQEGSNIYTDCHAGYRKLHEYNHASIKHSVGEYVRNQVYTNGIESFWSLLKRAYIGVYHYMSSKHLQRYVNEFAGRFNGKKVSLTMNIERVITNSLNKQLTYKRLINA